MSWGSIELEPEVELWLEALPDEEWAQAMFHLDLLESRGVGLGFPYTSQLDGKLRELRFYCGGQRVRVTYYIAGERRIIMLTVFRKTRARESAEVRRAARAMNECVRAGHTVDGEEE
ncbi:type II toxin-antitoxin system RelE/ParE family toxin [Nocardiopsis sp. HUAS JQ3]|uniref:type II toxin-antitoxin system RelE/ParE family toxin n=1 Tax=Nocardiopsis sp. HUAS JQ3 TaxID=3061629 RepID=UPI0023A9FA67|nr:type II toxin-antitoxin system RelE/ParE family toxin [Nocardiopsis sp. HUAS JQ3]WDZ90491.1 type II toxin-antitoxin system RelE/ParE family toxin [Nocardiopsis sp. HUAS JQ3]